MPGVLWTDGTLTNLQSVAVQPEEQCDTMSHSERVNLASTFLSDELPATDSLVPRTVPRLSTLTQVGPAAWFSFFWGIDQSLQKIQQELENPQVGISHQFTSVLRSSEALHSPLELSSTCCMFSRDSPVVDKSFTEISRSQVGGAQLGTEQKYFRDLAAMTRRRLCISSFQDWTGAALNQSIQGLIDHVDIGSVSQNSCWNSLRQLYSCLNQGQQLGTMALPWIAPSPTTSYCINGTKLSPLVPLEEREDLRTAPFGASSLFDELATNLQLRDKVGSQQQDYTSTG